ncbi:MAG: hypothetical protein HY692_06840 [Cyanobacteria bacterium NC_groundwater_1444_Ag_S-0.65um_54_12]|nr:hypothetical protein [Cyanobacteria bacterium NC_groundwater_1444_Ag_S-0.65um_54_12]
MTPDQEEAKRQLLDRLGTARKAISQASGWVRGLSNDDLKPFGIDIKPEVADSMDRIVTQLDEITDMLNGDRISDARGIYRYKYPEWKRYFDLARLLWGNLNP